MGFQGKVDYYLISDYYFYIDLQFQIYFVW